MVDVSETIQKKAPPTALELAQIAENQKDAKKTLSAFELRFRDTLASASADVESQANSASSAENQTSWSKKITNFVVGTWNRLWGISKPSSKEDELSPEAIGSRPVLEGPGLIGKQHLKKLLHDMSISIARLEDILKDSEEIFRKDPDVTLMLIIKQSSLRQNDLTKQEISDRSLIHAEFLDRNKEAINEINRVRGDLLKKTQIVETLNWINAILTGVVVVGGVALIAGSGGSGLGAVVLAAGVFQGSNEIVKAIIEDRAADHKAQIEFFMTNRQETGYKIELNLNNLEQMVAAMHTLHEIIIAAIVLQRDTIRYAQS